jgi:xanthine dehydrogenase accessory factor
LARAPLHAADLDVRTIIDILERWTGDGATVALGTIVERAGSAPRDPGAALAVSASGEVEGGVTGGCVEPAVISEAREVLGGAPGRLVEYGLDDEGGFGVGLNCGGRIAVAVHLVDAALVKHVARAVRADRPVAVTTCLEPGRFGEQLLVTADGDSDPHPAAAMARSLLELGESGIVQTSDGGKYFVETYAPRPNLYLFGGSEHVAALVPIGKQLGYRVTVCDPRTVFLTSERFPAADELSSEWPDRFLARAPIDARTAICMMTHEPRFDVPALDVALRSNAGFIGAMGSERIRVDRNARLRERGIGEADLARLHAPVGIQIGARTPEEVAVTIAAQLIEARVVARNRVGSAIRLATVLG